METTKCEICGQEINKHQINPFTLFGQKVCSNNCLEERAEREVKIKFGNAYIEKEQRERIK